MATKAETCVWLNCTAGRGQFEDEFAIRGKDYQGGDFSLFVSGDNVQIPMEKPSSDREEVSANVRVVVIAEEDDLFLIQLPGPTFDNGRTITVRRAQLER